MSESVESALTESERATAQELFGQLDFEVPDELEWEANSRLVDLRTIMSLGIEMRYNVVTASYDQESYYHYWTYTSGTQGVTFVVAQDSADYARQHLDAGTEIEGDEPVFTPVYLGEISRTDLLQMDVADVVDLDSLREGLEYAESLSLSKTVSYWEQSGYLPDSMWLFLSHQMLGSQRANQE